MLLGCMIPLPYWSCNALESSKSQSLTNGNLPQPQAGQAHIGERYHTTVTITSQMAPNPSHFGHNAPGQNQTDLPW